MTPRQVIEDHWFAVEEIGEFGDGHINDSFLCRSDGEAFVLQKINRYVFKDPHAVMSNLARIAEHVTSPRLARLIPERGGALFAEVDGQVWRVWEFVEGITLQRLQSRAQAVAAGRAFGEYLAALRTLPGAPWADPIRGFHRLDGYLLALDQVLDGGCEWDAEIAGLRELGQRFSPPTGYIHADPKVNNLRFAEDGSVRAVLDLDTTMWGHWAWDFGDLARSACADGNDFSLERFQGVAEGYLPHVIGWTPEDAVLAPRYVAGMLAVRFLTDHLSGDVYFRVKARGDNLARAREQFALYRETVRLQRDMRAALASSGAVETEER